MAQLIDRPPIVVGVDLGNANCRLMPWHDPDSQPVLLDSGSVPMYPALVARDQELGGWLIGASALECAFRDSVEVYDRLKEGILGSRGSGDAKIAVQRLLSKLKFSVQADCAARVVDSVLSVPYSYTIQQRNALKEACALAGLPVAGLINEPEAAVLGYRVDTQLEDEAENILVFDAGASRCTASVVRVSKRGAYLDVELLSEVSARMAEGDLIGGDAIDERLRRAFEKGRLQVPPLPPSFSPTTGGDQGGADPVEHERWLRHQLVQLLRSARHQLSGEPAFEFPVPWDEERTGRLTRDDLERWASFDLEISAAIQTAVRGARSREAADGFNSSDIDRVLIVGALNRSPFISRLVDQFPHVEPREEGFEEIAVAAGAARCAAALTGRCDDLVFRPRETPAFGIRTGVDTFDKVIPENAPPRFRAKKVYTLPNHYADRLVLEVCQGFSRSFLPEMSLGREELALEFPEGVKKGTYLEREIHVEMALAGTTIQVTVTDRTKEIAQPVLQKLEFKVR